LPKTFNAAPNALVISRLADGQIEMINDSFERLFGFTRAEVIGKTSLELNMFADPAAREKIVQQLRSDHFLRNYSTDVRIRSGDIRHVELSVEMLTIDSDDYIFTIIVDITERIRAEQILRESERQQREMASLSRSGTIQAGSRHRKFTSRYLDRRSKRAAHR
jgi:PAS domain S-box-containing protein